MLGLARKLGHTLAIDKAVFWGITARVWALVAGPVTALMVAYFYSKEIQGYYYTFISLLAMQVFLELGLSNVILRFASHEWAKLGFDSHGNIVGCEQSLSRLSSLARFSFYWYGIASVILGAGLSTGGYYFFSIPVSNSEAVISWIGPWLLLCVITSFNLVLIPVWALIQGCDQMAQVNFFRCIEAILRWTTLWAGIYFGAELWAVDFSALAMLISAIAFLLCRYRSFVYSLIKAKVVQKIDWKNDLLPMQWRIAVSWLSGYFVFSSMTPIVFYYRGAELAGQLGMTLSLAGAISSITSVWISARVPQFGILIARNQYAKLDRLALRLGLVSTGMACLGAVGVITIVVVLNKFDYYLATRVLQPLPVFFFALANVALAISNTPAEYLRAHKREPLMPISVMSAILVALSTVIMAKEVGMVGVAGGYLAIRILALSLVISLFIQLRHKWHSDV